jgi:hypothetical protein
MKSQLFSLLALMVALPLCADSSAPEALKWDAESKQHTPKAGETIAAYQFTATNTSKQEVSINALRTSCGCTVAQLPTTPYKVAPGSNVTISVSLDFAGKQGQITKAVTVESSSGSKTLLVVANLPTPIKTESK